MGDINNLKRRKSKLLQTPIEKQFTETKTNIR